MEQWEYLVLDWNGLKKITKIQGKTLLQLALNLMGQKDWELAGVAVEDSKTIYYFKRRIDFNLSSLPVPQKEKSPANWLKGNHSLDMERLPENIEDYFGNTLIDTEIITEDQWEQAQEMQKAKNLPIEKVLIELGMITENEANQLLEKYLGTQHIKLSEYILEKEALDLVSKEICKKQLLIPVSLEGRILTIAMADPRDTVAIDNVKLLAKEEVAEIRVVHASLDDIQRTIEMYYGGDLFLKPAKENRAIFPKTTIYPPLSKWTRDEIAKIQLEQIIDILSGKETKLLAHRHLESICWENHCVPFFLDNKGENLALAMPDPYKEEVLKEITDWGDDFCKSISVYKITASEEEILELLRKIFPDHGKKSIGLNRP